MVKTQKVLSESTFGDKGNSLHVNNPSRILPQDSDGLIETLGDQLSATTSASPNSKHDVPIRKGKRKENRETYPVGGTVI